MANNSKKRSGEETMNPTKEDKIRVTWGISAIFGISIMVLDWFIGLYSLIWMAIIAAITGWYQKKIMRWILK